MPVLDANALETDPDGMAFLRAVLRPKGGRTESVPQRDQPSDARPPVKARLRRQAEVPQAPFPCEAPASGP